MGKVVYATGIDYVQGSLAKPKKKSSGHKCGTYLIGTHRVAATTNPNCTRLYVRNASVYERTSLPTSNEMDARTRFAAVGAAVRLRAKDLMNISTDQAAFEAQKNLANGAKTFRAYLWKVCGQAYDAQHQ